MQIFFAPDITGVSYTLDEKESKHLIRVLRMTKGSEVSLIDGNGNLYYGKITDPDQSKCTIAITGKINNFEQRNYWLHIAISPLKNPERLEWFIEKSVEIGIDEITPLLCKNTEKSGIKAERIHNIIISAMKQSLKARTTIFNKPCSFNDFIKKDLPGTRMIAYCSESPERHSVPEVYSKNNDAIILIGPEGDFSAGEIESAMERQFIPVHLGLSRLRTETAGIAACHSVYLLNQ